jgi:hypothetical protein
MKKNNHNALVFNKRSLVELNDDHLLMINGGTNPVIVTAVIPVASLLISFGAAVFLEVTASLVEGATDAIRTK